MNTPADRTAWSVDRARKFLADVEAGPPDEMGPDARSQWYAQRLGGSLAIIGDLVEQIGVLDVLVDQLDDADEWSKVRALFAGWRGPPGSRR